MTTAEPDKGTGPGPPERAAPGGPGGGRGAEPVSIRDKRRVRQPGGKHAKPGPEGVADQAPEPATEAPGAEGGPDDAGGAGGGPPAAEGLGAEGLGAELAALRTALDERTRDLQRISAEYANYRKRVERDRTAAGEQATASVLGALLPVLDDLDRAREHGELPDGVAAIADQLGATTSKFGLAVFGEKGDLFDPNRHEAVAYLPSPEVSEPTCVDVLRRGYLLGNRLLRPAMVAVAAPTEEA